MNILHKDREEIIEFCNKYGEIYVYGAGLVAKFICKNLEDEKIKIAGIIVSDGKKQNSNMNKIKIFELSEVNIKETDGVFLAVAANSQKDIINCLFDHGVKAEQIYCQRIYYSGYNGINVHSRLLPMVYKGSGDYFSTYTCLNEFGEKYGTDKSGLGHNYLKKYEFFLKKWEKQEFNFLELGVFNGASLKMWEDYFPKANIYGVDIDPKCKMYEGGRKKVFIKDLSEEKNLEELKELSPSIVIDDASHMWSHQIEAMIHLIPALPSGGIFIMEDLQTSFTEYSNQIFGDANISTYDFCSQIARIVCGNEHLNIENCLASVWQLKEEIEKIAMQIEMISFIYGSCIMIKR